MSRKHCGCTNHLGGPKQMHASRDAAITAILDRHLEHGPHEIYPCPSVDGVLHVRSVLRRRLPREARR